MVMIFILIVESGRPKQLGGRRDELHTIDPMPYDRSALIQTHLYTHADVNSRAGGYEYGRDEYNGALREYYQGLLATLEKLFDVVLDAPRAVESTAKVLLMLFASTARSYLAAQTPWSGYLEAGLLINRLRVAGEPGRRVLEAGEQIGRLFDESGKQHLDMLDGIVEILLGDRADLEFDSADLLAAGFDVTAHPDSDAYPGFEDF